MDTNKTIFTQVELIKRHFFNRIDVIAAMAPWGKACPAETDDFDALLQGHLSKDAPPVTVRLLSDGKHFKEVTGNHRVGTYAPALQNTTRWVCFDCDGGTHKDPLADPTAAAIEIYRGAQRKGLSAYIERSGGGHGFHVWIFFDVPVPASSARKLAFDIIPTDTPLADGTFANPRASKGIEVFPKQDAIAPDGFGNLVWLPWWHGAAPGGNQFLWLNGLGKLEPFEPTFIKTNTMPVVTIQPAPNQQVHRASPNHSQLPSEKLQLVLSNCDALRSIAEKAKTEVLGSSDGMALLWMAIQFEGGRKWFRKNVTGWDSLPPDVREVDHSVKNGYAPLSCKTMQERGLCSFSDCAEQCLSVREPGRSRSPMAFAHGAVNQRHIRAKLKSILGK